MTGIRPLLTAVALSSSCVESPYRAAEARASEASTPRVLASRPEFVPNRADGRDIAALVREASAQALREDRRVLVYVGASWCEPCQHFHEAVDAGQLDVQLAGIRFLEFDADIDGDALASAGYGGKLIPRFVIPDADGHGGEAKIEGGIKGEGAVGHIMGRLRPLLD